MIKIISNGSKWYGEKADSIEVLKKVLENQILDPIFEKYGDFINKSPKWIKPEASQKYKDCTVISGNFKTYSHVFNIITDDKKIIEELKILIDKNKTTKEYQEYRKEIFN